MQVVAIQYLRFIAAALVLIGHTLMEAHEQKIIGDPLYQQLDRIPWGSGVDIFFVISGFIICLVASRTPRSTSGAAEFLLRRFIRIAPIYYVYTALIIVAVIIFGERMDNTEINAWRLVSSVLFIPSLDETGSFRPLLAQGWTLNYEMFFYLIYAAAILMAIKWRGLIVTGLLVCAFLLSLTLSSMFDVARFYASDIIFEFTYGIGAYYLISHVGNVRRAIHLALGATGFVALLALPSFVDGPRAVIQGIPAGMIVVAFALNASSAPKWGWLETLGDASYSLYLSHPFVINVFAIAASALPRMNWAIFCVLAGVASVVFSVLSFLFIERPITASLRDLTSTKRPAPTRTKLTPLR